MDCHSRTEVVQNRQQAKKREYTSTPKVFSVICMGPLMLLLRITKKSFPKNRENLKNLNRNSTHPVDETSSEAQEPLDPNKNH